MDKVIFNITFHWQLDQLKWHLENIFSWESSDNYEYLLVSAHEDNLSKINDVQNFISFEGWKHENTFQSYLSICDIGISPLESNIHHDTTYANKIFQYMSFGCPMICSNVVAQKEIIEKYKVGELFSPGNVDEFTEKVISLYNDASKTNSYNLNSKNAIKNFLNNDIVSKEIIKMYD